MNKEDWIGKWAKTTSPLATYFFKVDDISASGLVIAKGFSVRFHNSPSVTKIGLGTHQMCYCDKLMNIDVEDKFSFPDEDGI